MSESIKNESNVKSRDDLPPPRDRKVMRSVSPPFANTPLHRFNYYISFFAVAVFAFYSWRLLQWKTEVGGWWNLALGQRPPRADAAFRDENVASTGGTGCRMHEGCRAGGRASVEERIEDLAAALGMPSSELADAIADAVRAHVPPASLSSVVAHEPSG